jgi:hypothetical protein
MINRRRNKHAFIIKIKNTRDYMGGGGGGGGCLDRWL